MSTLSFSFRSSAAVVAGALLTMVLVTGCITHPPDTERRKDNSKDSITHPPDRSKEGPRRRHYHGHPHPPPVGATPAPITHPGE